MHFNEFRFEYLAIPLMARGDSPNQFSEIITNFAVIDQVFAVKSSTSYSFCLFCVQSSHRCEQTSLSNFFRRVLYVAALRWILSILPQYSCDSILIFLCLFKFCNSAIIRGNSVPYVMKKYGPAEDERLKRV